MKISKRLLLIAAIAVLLANFVFTETEVIEKIYAVVNDEIITYTELKHFEQGIAIELRARYQGEELQNKLKERKGQLLNLLIEQKLLLSKAKERNYEVDQYLEVVIQEIMKQNDIPTREELKKAIEASGVDYEEWKRIRREEIITQTLIRDEIGNKVQVGNSEIMEYYRKNTDKYTEPAELTLNCIFLDKQNYFVNSALEEKKAKISARLQNGAGFEEVGKEYSELPNPDDKILLGTFKQGELNAEIEKAAFKLKKGELSPWIGTDNGWYIIQLVNLKESRLIEFKEVREQIVRTIKEGKMQQEIKKYIEQLKQDSHIEIYHEYK